MISEKKSDAWISVIDESIHADVARSMNLFLQCGTDFFTAAVLDTDRNKYVALLDYRFPYPMDTRDLRERILDIIEQNKTLLDNRYESVSLSFCGFKNTLLPDAFFNADKMELLFSTNHPLADDETLLFDNLRRISGKNLYAVPEKLYHFFTSYYSNLSVFHGATSFIEGLLTQHKNTTGKVVTINVQGRNFEMVVNSGGDLEYYNRFNYQTAEDFMYYLVFVYEQLELNPETDTLMIAGTIEKNSTLLALIRKYIRNTQFVQRPSFCFYSYGFDDVASHYHFSLYNQYLCV
ncbi:MAG: DUF3822 family protein [Bacteroidetes bacterium]|jgi:hypothetical protein|nr:DUF3822 family protein [Bacteroidota bacterium]